MKSKTLKYWGEFSMRCIHVAACKKKQLRSFLLSLFAVQRTSVSSKKRHGRKLVLASPKQREGTVSVKDTTLVGIINTKRD